MKANITTISRSLCLLVLCSLLVTFICCSCGADRKAADASQMPEPPTEENNEKNLIAWAKVGIQRVELEKNGTCNDVYPTVYKGIEEHKISGKTEEAAIKKVTKNFITNRALYKYAEEENLSVSKDEVDNHIKQILKFSESADNSTKIKEAFKKAGTTFEASLWADRQLYKNNVVYEKLHQRANAFLEKRGNTSLSQEENWEVFQRHVVLDYMKSNDYKAIKKKLGEAIAYYKSHNWQSDDAEKSVAGDYD